MSIGRIVQLVVVVVATVYVVIVQGANPAPLALPGLLPLPLWLVLAVTAVVAFGIGRIPPAWKAWRNRREIQKLERRIAELESHVPSYDRSTDTPVIPDRSMPRLNDVDGPAT